jgi:hypothetical protein
MIMANPNPNPYPYGKGRCVNKHSEYFNQILTIDAYIPWRDGSRSVWVTDAEGWEMSFPEKDIELIEVFRGDDK